MRESPPESRCTTPACWSTRCTQSRVLIVITGLIGSFVFSLIRPNGRAGSNAVLADGPPRRYVRVGEQLHPVLNLTRLIVGRRWPDDGEKSGWTSFHAET